MCSTERHYAHELNKMAFQQPLVKGESSQEHVRAICQPKLKLFKRNEAHFKNHVQSNVRLVCSLVNSP